MARTGWQMHSIRGFLSGTVAKKKRLAVVSIKGHDGERTLFDSSLTELSRHPISRRINPCGFSFPVRLPRFVVPRTSPPKQGTIRLRHDARFAISVR